MKRLAALGMVPPVPGMAALDMNTAEDAIVNNTREVVPGLVLTGMELAEVGICKLYKVSGWGGPVKAAERL